MPPPSFDARSAPQTIAQALAGAVARGLTVPEARTLLARAAAIAPTTAIAHAERTLDAEDAVRFDALVAARRRGEPLAYLVGEREFYGRIFRVGPGVLIPRSETELLVEFALEHAAHAAAVLDLGTGSGAIAVSIAAARADLRVTAVDRFDAALEFARRNAETHTPGRVRFVRSDWYAELDAERFDVIVSNPPYIAQDDPHLAQGDLRFEPAHALTDGADGTRALREIIERGMQHLRTGAWLAVEHGYDQAPRVRTLFARAGYADVASRHDLAGIERITFGRTTPPRSAE